MIYSIQFYLKSVFLNFLIVCSINYNYRPYNKIMTERNHSDIGANGVQEGNSISQNLSQFYKLHYPQRKTIEDKKNSISFRAKSVNNIIPSKNPEQLSQQLYIQHKKSLKERIKHHQKHKQKNNSQKKQVEKFSFKQLLSKDFKTNNISEYFEKFPNKTHVDLDQYSRKNIGVKLAIQKCKDEKIKIQKVIASTKQTDQTKLDYLQLKKKDIEEQIKNEIKSIYEEYFIKDYQSQKSGFAQFQSKIRMTIQILQHQMFNNK